MPLPAAPRTSLSPNLLLRARGCGGSRLHLYFACLPLQPYCTLIRSATCACNVFHAVPPTMCAAFRCRTPRRNPAGVTGARFSQVASFKRIKRQGRVWCHDKGMAIGRAGCCKVRRGKTRAPNSVSSVCRAMCAIVCCLLLYRLMWTAATSCLPDSFCGSQARSAVAPALTAATAAKNSAIHNASVRAAEMMSLSLRRTAQKRSRKKKVGQMSEKRRRASKQALSEHTLMCLCFKRPPSHPHPTQRPLPDLNSQQAYNTSASAPSANSSCRQRWDTHRKEAGLSRRSAGRVASRQCSSFPLPPKLT